MDVKRIQEIITSQTSYVVFEVILTGDVLNVVLDSHHLSVDQLVGITNEISQLLEKYWNLDNYILDISTKGMYQPIGDYHHHLHSEVSVFLTDDEEVINGVLIAVCDLEIEISCNQKGQRKKRTIPLERIEVVKKIEL